MSRVPLRDVRRLVQQRQEFQANSMYAQDWIVNGTPVYVVFSYGVHWPMLIYLRGKWYGNRNKYSATTSRHMSAANPGCVEEWLSCDDMKCLLHTGEPPPPEAIRRLLAVSIGP